MIYDYYYLYGFSTFQNISKDTFLTLNENNHQFKDIFNQKSSTLSLDQCNSPNIKFINSTKDKDECDFKNFVEDDLNFSNQKSFLELIPPEIQTMIYHLATQKALWIFVHQNYHFFVLNLCGSPIPFRCWARVVGNVVQKPYHHLYHKMYLKDSGCFESPKKVQNEILKPGFYLLCIDIHYMKDRGEEQNIFFSSIQDYNCVWILLHLLLLDCANNNKEYQQFMKELLVRESSVRKLLDAIQNIKIRYGVEYLNALRQIKKESKRSVFLEKRTYLQGNFSNRIVASLRDRYFG